MAPDRGDIAAQRAGIGPNADYVDSAIDDGRPPGSDGDDDDDDDETQSLRRRSSRSRSRSRSHGPLLATTAKPGLEAQGRSFTVRGVGAGLLVGLVICFSNMYFGLQTGWVSTMTMPASLMGFGIFRTLSRHLRFPFSPVENVLVQTVAGSMAIMPLGCGFVGVLPALNYLLRDEELGPVVLSTWQLVVWSLGLCYFGVVFAVPLRRQVIIREKLKFPSGFSTAVLISVLHGKTGLVRDDAAPRRISEERIAPEAFVRVASDRGSADEAAVEAAELLQKQQWKANVRLLLACFFVSGLYTFATYFFPILRNLPIFGATAASTWLWTLNPSLAYVGQGIIMGPATTIHMLLGAILGWGILSPLAKYKGWAPGDIDDWESGSKGWIVWTSLAIMLADAVVSLGYLAARPLLTRLARSDVAARWHAAAATQTGIVGRLLSSSSSRNGGYTTLRARASTDSDAREPPSPLSDLSRPRESHDNDDDDDNNNNNNIADVLHASDGDDAPASQLISTRTVVVGLALSVAFCIGCIHAVFGALVPLYATTAAVGMALVLSIMGVRALGETDLNPVSGISKLAQLFFALVVPQAQPGAVVINLVAGAVSEAGALQAGDLMQDLKTGHLLGAAPAAQFWGQVVGATAGAVASAFVYRLYTAVYDIPGSLFPVPTAYVWVFTARLVTGQGLPPAARECAVVFAALFAAATALRTYAAGRRWQVYVPGGIAVAVGMYNVPSFTLARTAGGLAAWLWRRSGRRAGDDTPLIVLASGFVLGEGFLSIVNLLMQSAGVPHL